MRLLERSLAIRQRLADTDPENVQTKERLGYVLAHVSRLQVKRGEWSAARPRAHEAIRVLQGVFGVTKDRTAQEWMAYAWLALGGVERAAGDRTASCRAFRRANDMYRLLTEDKAADRGFLIAEAAREAAACR